LARSVAMITHSLVKKFCRSSGMVIPLRGSIGQRGMALYSRVKTGSE
jgi:hypothetical protein